MHLKGWSDVKKILSLLLVAAFAVSLIGCSGGETTKKTSTTEQKTAPAPGK